MLSQKEKTQLQEREKKRQADREYYLKNYDRIWAYRKSEEYRLRKKDWLKNHPGYYTEYGKAYRQKNREKRLADGKRYYQENYNRIKQYRTQHNKDIRLRVLQMVGRDRVQCTNCPCDDIRLLEVNHINGGGTAEIKRNNTFHYKILSGVRKIDDLEIRCRVCNALHYLESKYGRLPFTVSYKNKER